MTDLSLREIKAELLTLMASILLLNSTSMLCYWSLAGWCKEINKAERCKRVLLTNHLFGSHSGDISMWVWSISDALFNDHLTASAAQWSFHNLICNWFGRERDTHTDSNELWIGMSDGGRSQQKQRVQAVINDIIVSPKSVLSPEIFSKIEIFLCDINFLDLHWALILVFLLVTDEYGTKFLIALTFQLYLSCNSLKFPSISQPFNRNFRVGLYPAQVS